MPHFIGTEVRGFPLKDVTCTWGFRHNYERTLAINPDLEWTHSGAEWKNMCTENVFIIIKLALLGIFLMSLACFKLFCTELVN